MKKLLILLLIFTAACQKKQGAETTAENYLLMPAEFQQKLAATADAQLLDVRTLQEVQEEYIKGQVNFDFKRPEFDVLIQGLDKSKAYFVYCASGVRSANAAEKMRGLGFTKVYTLDGGIKAWKAAGLPTQSASH